MSAFEKIPREIRDLIYEHCLLYGGEIVPFPDDYDMKEIEGWPHVGNGTSSSPQREATRTSARDAFFGYICSKRGDLQTENRPCAALLGVNSTIRDEAASILFGKNVWRLSSNKYVQEDRCRLWETYAKYFRHVITKFDARDIDETQLLDISMSEMDRIDGDTGHFDQAGTANIHQEQLSLLEDSFIKKRDVLQRMHLKSLSLDFSKLYCPIGCCRREALQSCLVFLGSTGPWYTREQERGHDLKTKLKTDVKILGIKDDKEKKLFREAWGLKVD